jgi:hypothetical protein
MTFNDDYIQFRLANGVVTRASCKQLQVDWPPPLLMVVETETGFITLRREGMSKITDDQRMGMRHVCRGASYVQEIDPE